MPSASHTKAALAAEETLSPSPFDAVFTPNNQLHSLPTHQATIQGTVPPNTQGNLDSQNHEDAPETPCVEQCWVVIGDVHGDVRSAARIPEIHTATGIIITGDLTKLGGVAQAHEVIDSLQEMNTVVLAQIGNMDRPEVNDWLEREGMNLHCKVRELAPHVALLGVGGSTFTPFGTPSEFPEARFAEWLEMLALRARDYRTMVLISHNPPFETVCDRTHAGNHVGCRALREFIEEKQPTVCLCGHIHEAYGLQLVGRTQVANPGALAAGGYALLHVSETVHVTLHRLEA